MITIKANSKVLFQGDSVTDCYRDRNDELSLGNSYVKDVAKYLNKFNIKIVNKAIAGNKVNDLINRFDNDFKNIKPDYIFILIGVNDTWHNYPNQKQTTVFEVVSARLPCTPIVACFVETNFPNPTKQHHHGNDLLLTNFSYFLPPFRHQDVPFHCFLILAATTMC